MYGLGIFLKLETLNFSSILLFFIIFLHSLLHFISGGPDGTVQLEFLLYRNCGNRGEELLGTWYYEISNEDDNHAETFSFFWCDCNSCTGCCFYSVKCKPVSVDEAAISVNNCHMVAMAQSGI